jgi:hypothetical protein
MTEKISFQTYTSIFQSLTELFHFLHFKLDYIDRNSYIKNMNTENINNDLSSQNDRVNARINAALKGIRYGSVILTIHDSKIVQIERIEKSRFDDLYLENGEGI